MPGSANARRVAGLAVMFVRGRGGCYHRGRNLLWRSIRRVGRIAHFAAADFEGRPHRSYGYFAAPGSD
jgi:hypothetical protein